MNCEEVMELMQRHVDGDLDPQETSRMTDHIEQCPECAVMLGRLLLLSSGLEQLPRVVPPYSLVDAILPELANWDAAGTDVGEPARLGPRGRRAERPGRAWIGGLAGVVALGVAVGLFLVNGPGTLPFQKSDNQKEVASAPSSTDSPSATDSKIMREFSASIAPQASASASPSASSSESAGTPPKVDSQMYDVITPSSAQPSSGAAAHSAGGAAPIQPKDKSGDQAKTFAEPRVGPRGIAAPSASPTQEAAPTATKGITSIAQSGETQELLSPDGQWKAVIQDGALKLIHTSDNSLAYNAQAPEGVTRSDLSWSEDSSAVYYTNTDAQGNATSMSLSVSDKKETAR
jgi:anti-sigma factor RsiW